MRNWQYSWGHDEDHNEWHNMDFFTDYGWYEISTGNRPSIYMIAAEDYDDCDMPKAWQPV